MCICTYMIRYVKFVELYQIVSYIITSERRSGLALAKKISAETESRETRRLDLECLGAAEAPKGSKPKPWPSQRWMRPWCLAKFQRVYIVLIKCLNVLKTVGIWEFVRTKKASRKNPSHPWMDCIPITLRPVNQSSPTSFPIFHLL